MDSIFLTQSAVNARDSIAEDRPQDIFPPIDGYCPEGIVSTAPRTLKGLEEAAFKLTDALGASVDDEGISGPNAVPSNFFALFTVAGFSIDMYTPMVKNTKQREELGLYPSFHSTRDKEIFDKLIEAAFSRWINTTVHISRDSSTCFPYFVRTIQTKQELFIYTCHHWEDISRLIRMGDLEELYRRHRAVINYFLGVRLQPDKVSLDENGNRVSKDRYLWDLDYAMSGGIKGRTFVANKEINSPEYKINGHFRMRRRVVFGAAGWMNYFLNAIFSGFREHYLNEFEFTWKHKTPDQIYSKIVKYKHFLGFDVHQYDNTFARFMFDAWIEQMKKYVREDVMDLVDLALHSPFYQPNVTIGGSERLQIGNPFRIEDFVMDYGLPSGIPPNPDLGKMMMTFNLLVRLDREFHDVLEFGIPDILRGNHPLYAILNMGDDSILLLNDTQIATKMKKDIAEGYDPAPYFKMEKEASISFLGNVFYRDESGELRLAPNIVSMLTNWFVPEVGTSHKRRRYWGIGWEERNKYYMQAPGFSTAWEIINRVAYDHWDVDLDFYAKRGREIAGDPNLGSLSDLDRMVLDDPAKLHYRISELDISPELRNQIVTTLDRQTVDDYIAPLILAAAA